MDKLKAEQERLCEWLSDDSNYIIEQCGDILSVNESKKIQEQSCALEKMQVLLKTIIQKGEDTCQSFTDILRKHQEHCKQLRQFFNPNDIGCLSLTVAADSSSVATVREITGMKGKSLCMTTELRGPGSNRSGNIVRKGAQADYTASDGSMICADKMSNICMDGDITISASNIQERADAVERPFETSPSSQGPAVKMIREHKVELISCLMADCSFILNHVHAREIVTDRQYQKLKDVSQSEETVTHLIDWVMFNGQESCARFLKVLKESEVVRTYPQLNNITRSWC